MAVLAARRAPSARAVGARHGIVGAVGFAVVAALGVRQQAQAADQGGGGVGHGGLLADVGGASLNPMAPSGRLTSRL